MEEEVPRTQSGRDSFYGCPGEPLRRRQHSTFGQALQDEEELARDILGRKNGERWNAGDLMAAESSVPILWVTWALEMRMGRKEAQEVDRVSQAELSTWSWWQC